MLVATGDSCTATDDGVWYDASGVRIGSQVPPNYWCPEYVLTRGDKAIAFLNAIGYHLDPWQQLILRDLVGENESRKWAALEAVLLIPRQNGKTAITEALEIVHLFLFGTRLIIHTAHLFDTAYESYLRMCQIIEDCPALDKYVKQKLSGNGKVGIVLKNGARLLYKARGKGQIRGFSGDLVILDEAYDLDPEMIAALIPALSARKNPQVVYTSSTGNEDSAVLMNARDRGMNHEARIALFEWCAEKGCSLDDVDQWYLANPALGIRLDIEFIANVERGSMGEKEFARERLGLWHDSSVKMPIDLAKWRDLVVDGSQITSRIVLAVDSAPDRSKSSIALAGYTADGKKQVEVESSGAGVSWCVDAIDAIYKGLAKTGQEPLAVCVQSGARAGALIPELEALDIEVIPFGSKEIMASTGFLYDSVEDGTIVHLGDSTVEDGLQGGRKYNIGGKVSNNKDGEDEYNGWGWTRIDTTVDITGVCAITYALWGLNIKRAEAFVEKKHYEGKPRGGRVW
ncbi:terminase large subunit [Mycobacterium phage MrMagoo]|uniref:Terminase large subunit n=1 Tax=Mycobacterium phage MrMagoo TaxID=1927020 RepID=A0A1L6BYF3_9CAUD|nr:terminase large subunit [Mycobacterium phage MrMagoo]APQ42123.1 terminase large subunit [Mycobacterium phage MrMagoo]ARM70198.1 terminase large subunit [Mycobacterium phage GardenSalsa]